MAARRKTITYCSTHNLPPRGLSATYCQCTMVIRPHNGQNLCGRFLRAILSMIVGLGVQAVLVHGQTKGLRNTKVSFSTIIVFLSQ